jgi:hypothetical protein
LPRCNGDRSARGNDTAETSAPPRITMPVQHLSRSRWDDAVGPWFVVPTENGPAGYVILPALAPDVALDTVRFDIKALQEQHVQLFNHGTAVGEADIEVTVLDSAADCPIWPTVQLRTSTTSWNVAFQPGRAHVFSQDTLAGLSAKDSSRLSIEVARLSSAVPNDTNVLFRGRPFVVRQAVRAVAGERVVLVAEVVRTINQEATPLQEHLLIIAEREVDARAWSTVLAERSVALEESAETTDILAIFRPVTSPEALLVLVSRDFGEGGAFALFERAAPGVWRLRWTSPFAGC